MARMFSSKESCLLSVIKFMAAIFRSLPYCVALYIARIIGTVWFYVLSKKRRVIYGNLKIAFASFRTPHQLTALTKEIFIFVTQSFVDLMCLPKIKRVGLEQYVRIEGREYLESALNQKKGVIILGIHSGSWELASLALNSLGYGYNIVANEQPKVPRIDDLLIEYRTISGAKIIAPGTGVTRDIIRALQNNEIVSLGLDQGGKEGVPVEFFGKTASFSTGALRLALKYKTPVCPVWTVRGPDGKNTVMILEPLTLEGVEDSEAGLKQALLQAAKVFEALLNDHPQEYLWFYKLYKYSTQVNILILDDGKTGHLRQSQAAASKLSEVLKKKSKTVSVRSVRIEFRGLVRAKLFSLYTMILSLCGLDANEGNLAFFLTADSFSVLSKERGDWVISSGSVTGGVNFFLKRCFDVRSICILKAGLADWKHFDLVIAPEHDKKYGASRDKIVFTKAALNVIAPAYLRSQKEQLLGQYSHLKNNVRFKIGILLGGNTKGIEFDEGQIHALLSKVKEAAQHYNADILITTSRRTPPEVEAAVVRDLKGFERTALCIIANSNNTPYAVGGILSLSDLLIVSGESISMVSEALSSGKRTIVFRPTGSYDKQEGLNKFDRFVLSLSDQGFILACSIKEISNSIAKMMTNKITLKTLQDNALVEKAFEHMLS